MILRVQQHFVLLVPGRDRMKYLYISASFYSCQMSCSHSLHTDTRYGSCSPRAHGSEKEAKMGIFHPQTSLPFADPRSLSEQQIRKCFNKQRDTIREDTWFICVHFPYDWFLQVHIFFMVVTQVCIILLLIGLHVKKHQPSPIFLWITRVLLIKEETVLF